MLINLFIRHLTNENVKGEKKFREKRIQYLNKVTKLYYSS